MLTDYTPIIVSLMDIANKLEGPRKAELTEVIDKFCDQNHDRLDDRERGAILAGLRFYQVRLEAARIFVLPKDDLDQLVSLDEIASNCGEFEAIKESKEFDALCEKINFS